MKSLTTCAFALLLSTAVAFAGDAKQQGVSISFASDDARTRIAPRHSAREARLAVQTRHGAAVLLLLDNVVAVQLSDSALAAMTTKEDASFLEELIVAGVGVVVRKSVEYPIAHIRSAQVRDGSLELTSDEGKPVFSDMKVNGNNVTRDLSAADATRFVNAFRLVKARH
jgi:hypothetical protein